MTINQERTAYEARFRSALKARNIDFIEHTTNIFDDGPDHFGVLQSQHVPDSFLQDLDDKRHASVHGKMGDMVHLASLPVALVNKWHRQGKRLDQAQLPEIIRWLQAEDAERFLATRRRLV